MQNLHIFGEQKKTDWVIFENLEKVESKTFTEEGSAIRLNSGKYRKLKAISSVDPDVLYSTCKQFLPLNELEVLNKWEPSWGKVREDILNSKVELWNQCMHESACQYAPEVVSTKAYWKSVQQHIWFCTSSSELKEDIRTCFMLDFYITVQKEGRTKQSNLTRSWLSPINVQEEDLQELVLYTANAAMEKLDARPFPSGSYALILGPLAAPGIFHEVVGHGLEADIASIPQSAFHQRLGAMVGCEKVTIIDDPTKEGLPGSYSLDDEGTIAQQTTLIEKGRVVNYLSHLHTGHPTNGHGRVINYQHLPLVRMSNTFLLPGTDDPEEMVSDTEVGLYVKKAINGDVNMITGEFEIHVAEGYLIEKGQITSPILPTTLKGDGQKLLQSIDRVGNDFAIHSEVRGGCGKLGQSPLPVSAGSPTVRVLDWYVKGADR
ncbi:TldD/PmbA family protein [Halalkalibacterium halodurans]|uniref:TldD/PmbA family protein n=1 Tax=Halalkalibacterium halodurans TaxID=86665 RepID=UPI002E1BFC84|nr:TldD/PmbA family protein [Halalkalibacterium halodurans]